MRKTLFAFLAIVFVSWVFLGVLMPASAKTKIKGSEYQLNCQLVDLKKIDVFLNEELNLKENPVLRYTESARGWMFQAGDVILDSRQQEKFTLRKRVARISQTARSVSIWIDGVRWYELELESVYGQAQLFWWGTVKRSQIADFTCQEVTKN